MKKIVKTAFWIFCFLIAAINSYAQNVKILTLNDAILTAKQNNSDLQIARLDKMKANEYVSEVYSENLLPTITLNSRYTRAFKKQVIQIFGQTYQIGSDNSISNILDVS